MEQRYLVTWAIDVYVDNHEEAAKAALAIMRDPRSIATVFDVTNFDTGEKCRVDILED